ncbi:PLC-like phosphodiesterase [Syncephalis plumigaleata]|nr:PLC-like phosphodiesterase [Syncephalis plumigaleata]
MWISSMLSLRSRPILTYTLVATLSTTCLLTVGLAPAVQAAAATTSNSLCNGYSELCDRTLDKITFATAHNAYAVSLNNPATNQHNSMATQLGDGIRGFMLDAHYLDPNSPTDNIQLCHTSCALFDGGSMTDGLKVFTKFLEENPREFIVIFVENFDNFNGAMIAKHFDASGLTKYAYYKNPSDDWPTLGSLIDQNKRVMFLFDRLSDRTAPWQMLEYDVCWETTYEIPYKEAKYTCAVDRPSVKPPKSLYVLNHFIFTTFSMGGSAIPIPNPDVAATVNSDPLKNHIELCRTQQSGVMPNFIAVDFYEQGDTLKLVAQLNGVNYTGNGGTKQSVDPSTSMATSYMSTNAMTIAITSVLSWFTIIMASNMSLSSWL